MDIGYIYLDTAQRNKVLGILQSLKEQGAIDELGIGRVRDAFSNLMFPGTSSLQKHAKYFTILPHLYKDAVRFKYKSKKEVYNKIIEMEINLTRQLINGSPENTPGITGSDFCNNKSNTTKYVKYDPTYIYMNGMRVFEIVKTNALHDFIYNASNDYNQKDYIRKPNRYEADQEGESDDKISLGISDFCISPKNKYNSSEKGINIALTRPEAEFLKRQIITAKDSKDSLLAFILKNDYDMTENFFDFDYNKLPDNFKNQYLRAKEFSLFIHGIYIRYNYLFSRNMVGGPDGNLNTYFINYISENNDIYTEETLDKIFNLIRPHVTDDSIKTFCYKALKAILNDKDKFQNLDNIIINREQTVKGNSRSKLINHDKYNYYPVHNYKNIFRWDISYTIVKEIKEGLENG